MARQDNGLFIIVVPMIKVWMPRERVSLHCLSWFIDERDNEFYEKQEVAGDMIVDILWAAVILQIFMVGVDFDWVFCFKEEMLPTFKP
jgi:hypothetical protein